MKLLSSSKIPNEKVIEFLTQNWGSPKMVISSGIYDCSTLDGIAVMDENQDIVGLLTYIIRESECEIISLDSIREGKGIGTALIEAVEMIAREKNCTLITLITTNDNVAALKFYQKRGFSLSRILRNAVEQARRLKPEIPLIGNDGIPIRDEIELEKSLQ